MKKIITVATILISTFVFSQSYGLRLNDGRNNDGTLDMRYKENRQFQAVDGYNLDGTPDMRRRENKETYGEYYINPKRRRGY